MVQDLVTQWIQACPCTTKTLQETQRSLHKILEPERKPKVIYTDNSLEFGKACEDLSWNICTVETTQIGNKWDCWKSSAQNKRRHLCPLVAIRSGWKLVGKILRNVFPICEIFKISCLVGKTPYERRFGKSLNGPIIPFGSLVEYYPISAEDQTIHQFGKKI